MGSKKFGTRARRRIAPLIDGEPQRAKYDEKMEIEELWEDIQMHRFDDLHDGHDTDRGLNELDRMKRLQVIREMPVPFQTRKKLRDHMNEIGESYQGKGFAAWKYKQKLNYEKWKKRRIQAWNNFKYAIELWGTTCTKIEGYAGSGVVSYFRMLRWIFQMNFFLFILILGFIIVPQVLFPSPDYASFGSSLGDVQDLQNSTNTSLIVTTCSSFYVNNITKASSIIDNIFNFLYGSGWMEETAMFYGYYDSHNQRTKSFDYDVSAAYISTNFAVYFVSLLVLVRVAGGGYQARLESKDSHLKSYAAKIYAFWDYGLTSAKNSENKQKSIWRELQLDLDEERRRRTRDERSGCDYCLLGTKRLIINFFILASLGAAGYLIYFVSVEQAQLIEDPNYASWHTVVQFLVQFMTSLAISVLNAILPMIYKFVVTWEDYSPAFEVNMTLFRTIFLKLASLTILIITIYTTITCGPQDVCGTGTGTCAAVKCWETYIGQELYKLIIMDFIIAVLMTFFIETPRALIGKCCKAKVFQLIGRPTFDLPKNVLDLIYGQTLLWLGVFFSPIIPAIIVIKLFLVFYLKYFSTMINYQPHETPFRASDTQSFYVYILFFDFIICLIPTFYVIWQLAPSRGCGPFRDLPFMYRTIGDGVSAAPNWLNDVLSFIISPLVLITIIFILFLALWYLIAKLGAYERLTKMYRDELSQEGQTVQALIKVIQSRNVNQEVDAEAQRVLDKRNHRSQRQSYHEDIHSQIEPYTKQNGQIGPPPDDILYQYPGDFKINNVDETHDRRPPISKAFPEEIERTDTDTIPHYTQIDKNRHDKYGHDNRAYDDTEFFVEPSYARIEDPPMDYEDDDDDDRVY